MRGPEKEKTERARQLRRDSTAAESKLWSFLRGRQLDGFKFNRQEPIGPYFVDFACRKGKLVIEIDGPSHDEPDAQIYDAKRTAFLEAQGYRVLRFTNDDILGDVSFALESIVKHLTR
jgi:very-short-patch-repair endonuclease